MQSLVPLFWCCAVFSSFVLALTFSITIAPTPAYPNIPSFKMRYRPGLPLVLRGKQTDENADHDASWAGISFAIEQGKSIGVVGRSGAGKSSLLQALFRMVEVAGGQICIDGVDIATVGLQRLRTGLSIIPQDLVLFSGTLRDNIDPDQKYSDEEVWSVLRDCELEEFVRSKPDGLQHEISPNGENLAVGQQQLCCLARALIRNSKVIVLDEATSSVDNNTDALIQRALAARAQQNRASVVTIAHRINTIVSSDMVIVMDAGNVLEFGSTVDLLADENSALADMARASGIPVGDEYRWQNEEAKKSSGEMHEGCGESGVN